MAEQQQLPGPDPVLAASVVAQGCCPDCRACRILCPGCGRTLSVTLPADQLPPVVSDGVCPGCRAHIQITVIGWAVTSDLEQQFHLPAGGDEQ